MPRPSNNSRHAAMDARLAAVESSLESLPQMIHSSISAALQAHSQDMDTKLAVGFDQFRRELPFLQVGGVSSSDLGNPVPDSGVPSPITTEDGEFRNMTNPRYPRRDQFDGGGFPPRPPWQHRLDFPKFTDDDDPLAWIYKSEQYYNLYNVPNAHKVLTVSFHLENEALQWFRWRHCLNSTPTWSEFSKALCQEFGPSEFKECTEALFKLRQTGSLRDYITKFRRLANRTSDVGHSLLKSCFLGGLKRELKFDVKLFKPSNVHDFIALALQLDAKLSELKPPASKLVTHPRATPTPAPHASLLRPKPFALPFKKPTPEEVQQKKEKGEC